MSGIQNDIEKALLGDPGGSARLLGLNTGKSVHCMDIS